jgi:hypothetical protein
MNTIYSDSMSYSMNNIFIFVVAVIYSILLSNVGDKLGNYEEISKMCENVPRNNDNYFNSDNNRYNECYKIKNMKLDEFHANKLNFAFIAGTVSIIIGAVFNSQNLENYGLKSSGVGFGLGGVFLITYYVFFNWYKLTNNAKISIMAMSLAGMVFGISKLQK